MIMQVEEVTKVDGIKYLLPTVQSNGQCGRELSEEESSLHAGWNARSVLRQTSAR